MDCSQQSRWRLFKNRPSLLANFHNIKTHSLGLREDLFTLGESVSFCGGRMQRCGEAVHRRSGRERRGIAADGEDDGGGGELHDVVGLRYEGSEIMKGEQN